MATDKEKPARVEEAALNAELTSAHAEKAAEEADKADLEARKAAADEAGAKVCPNCRGELIQHSADSPHKAGAWHCNTCGGCFRGSGGKLVTREGHSEPVKV
jgi:ribosomal protein L37AE/L43A